MRKLILAAALLFAAPALADQPLMQLSSDQTSYTAGAEAKLTAIALVQPSSNDEIYIGSTFNGAAAVLNQANNGVGFYQTASLPHGASYWNVQLYLQDKVFADQLTNTIASLTLQNAQLTTEIGQTTNPTQLAALQAQQQQNNLVIQEAQNQLLLLRRPFGASQVLSILAN